MFIRRAWRSFRRKVSPYSIAATSDPCGDLPSTSCVEEDLPTAGLQEGRQRRRKFPWSFRRRAEKDEGCPVEGSGGFWQTSVTTLLQSKKSPRGDDCPRGDLVTLAEDDVQWRIGYVKLRCIQNTDARRQASREDLAEGFRKKEPPRGTESRLRLSRSRMPSRIRCGFYGVRRTKARLDLSKPSDEDVLSRATPSAADAIVDTLQCPPPLQAEGKDFETDFFESVSASQKGLPLALLPPSDTDSGNQLGEKTVGKRSQATDSYVRALEDESPLSRAEDEGALLISGSIPEQFHLVPESAEKLSYHSSSIESLINDKYQFDLPFLDYAFGHVTSQDEGLGGTVPGPDVWEERTTDDVTVISKLEGISERAYAEGVRNEACDAVTVEVLQTCIQKSEDGTAPVELVQYQDPAPSIQEVTPSREMSPKDEDGKMFIRLSVVEPLPQVPQVVKEGTGSLGMILRPSVVPLEYPGVENGSGDATVEVKLLIDV